MASKDKGGKGKGAPAAPQDEAPKTASALAYPEDRQIKDDTQFPVPELYFKVFDSEVDEPEGKIRRDVGKLYERWQEKYGRRWPENGMNTEDLVWLAEEAYKAPGQGPTPSAKSVGLVPVEKEEYPGEFISEPGEDGPAGSGPTSGTAAGKKAGKGKKHNLSNYEATAAGGNWVTDEFESMDYEAGNLESLWGMYLWDREGKPTIMPDGAPDEAKGEESEEWDDFYGSYRPRHVDTEEAREAVWATDEFESDEDNTESEWEPEYVGAGLGLDVEDPFNPQYSLRHSNHPLAPFPGEPLKWSSFVYDEGTTFEGLTRDAVPHGMGVMIFGNGTGGGFHFRDVRRGDKYEGEFQAGYAHGLGQLTSEARGEVYVGEFFAGQRHGCGIRINMAPYYYLLERGEDPVAAYAKTHAAIMRNIEFRTWYRNKALGSDNEDEVVFHAVRDDLDDPYAVVLRNARHEAKLRDWSTMSDLDKALNKAVQIIDGVGLDRARLRAAKGLPAHAASLVRDEEGRLVPAMASDGDDTVWDSVDMMVGVDSDGGPGLGWQADTQETEEFDYDGRLKELIAADVAEDKADESEDKEAVLGEDLVNPFTQLSLRDYLDGREGTHKELLARTRALEKLGGGKGKGGKKGGAAALLQADEDSSYVEGNQWGGGDLVAQMQKLLDKSLSRGQQDMFARDMARSAAAHAGAAMGRNPYAEDTDTRFETESDMMELCDLNEILGTVDEAQEVVAKARMWRWKPDGEVTLRYAQDAQGAPLPLMNDPLHYPHGTKFMAPGPLGQCHPVPDDKALRAEMLQVAHNYAHIHSLYNFDWDPEPGSVQYKIDQRIKRAQDLRLQSLARMAEAADEELGAAGAGPQLVASVAELPEEQGRGAGLQGAGQQAQSAQQQQGGWRWSGRGAGAPFASVSMAAAPFGAAAGASLSRASHVVLDALTQAAKHVPTRRPRIARPQRKQQ